MRGLLEEIARNQPGWVELRWHRRRQNTFMAQKGRVDMANSSTIGGVGVRVLEDGSFGFASTVDSDRGAIQKAVEIARANAREVAKLQKNKVGQLPQVGFAKGDFLLDGFTELESMPLEQKLQTVIDMEKKTAGLASSIHTAACSYTEMFEEKAVVTSDGASASQKLVRPELRLTAFAEACTAAGIEAQISAEIEAALWKKFIMLASFAGVSCMTRQPNGVIRDDPDLTRILSDATQEIISVALACGVNLPGDTYDNSFAAQSAFPDNVYPSMWFDLDAGKHR